MDVSVIVSTYNGEKKIAVLLNALRVQTYQDFELVIVIDGSTDHTFDVVKTFAIYFNKMKIVVQENRGRSVVKNRGASESSGNLLVFFDDDMEPSPDSIQKHVSFHQKFDALLTGNQIEIREGKKTDLQNYKAALSEKWTRKYTDGLNKLSGSDLFFTAANCSITRNHFVLLGGFDERLTDIEDLEFAKRALKKNVQIYFDKLNRAIHHDYISCVSYVNRVRQYTLAQQKLHTFFPKEFQDRKVELKYKRYFYWIFSFSFWPNLIDGKILQYTLPAFMRYKVYEWVIYSLGLVFINKQLPDRVFK